MIATAPNLRNSLVEEHLRLARRLAGKISCRLPSHFDYDDLKSDAYAGLWKAAKRYSPTHGVTFVTFATPIIKGAILDGLRERTRARSRRYQAVRTISLSTPDNEEDGCDCLGDTLMAKDLPVGTRLEFLDEAEAAMRQWPPRMREVMVERYMHGLSRDETGQKMGIRPTSVSLCLKHARALAAAKSSRRNKDG